MRHIKWSLRTWKQGENLRLCFQTDNWQLLTASLGWPFTNQLHKLITCTVYSFYHQRCVKKNPNQSKTCWRTHVYKPWSGGLSRPGRSPSRSGRWWRPRRSWSCAADTWNTWRFPRRLCRSPGGTLVGDRGSRVREGGRCARCMQTSQKEFKDHQWNYDPRKRTTSVKFVTFEDLWWTDFLLNM